MLSMTESTIHSAVCISILVDGMNSTAPETNMIKPESESLSSIPTEASIRTAKEKRERLRALGITVLADGDSSMDFISLSVAKQDASPASRGPHPDSRLQREDDEVGEGDEGQQRYLFLFYHLWIGLSWLMAPIYF
jgi:Nineteen complex-related protein 2